jgi:hypothetical protein
MPLVGRGRPRRPVNSSGVIAEVLSRYRTRRRSGRLDADAVQCSYYRTRGAEEESEVSISTSVMLRIQTCEGRILKNEMSRFLRTNSISSSLYSVLDKQNVRK